MNIRTTGKGIGNTRQPFHIEVEETPRFITNGKGDFSSASIHFSLRQNYS